MRTAAWNFLFSSLHFTSNCCKRFVGIHHIIKFSPSDISFEVVLLVHSISVISSYRAFSHDVTAAMLMFQNKEMAAMMVYQTNPPGIDSTLSK